MKKGVHPQVFPNATTTCSTCGSVFVIPGTVETQSIEVCRMCHPIYTGKKQVETRGGRIDRFRKRAEKSGKGK